MKIEAYYDGSGCRHTVKTEFTFNAYVIYLDGKHYATADDRFELMEVTKELIKLHGFTSDRPKIRQKNISSTTPASCGTR